MDMFLLFVVIFLCVMFSLGVSALALSLLFKLIVRLSGDRNARVAVTTPAISTQAPPI
jgi:hypothetical protein